MDDAIKYDYPLMQQCDEAIARRVKEMEATTEQFTSDARRLISEAWGGRSADTYDATVGNLKGALHEHQVTLQRLNDGLMRAAEDMRRADTTGSNNLEQV